MKQLQQATQHAAKLLLARSTTKSIMFKTIQSKHMTTHDKPT